MPRKTEKPDAAWRELLDPEEYRVTRQQGTEAPFSGQYWDEWQAGHYHCRCCGAELFDSSDKFDAGCGWPSFKSAVTANVEEAEDFSHGMFRIEVRCTQCGAHLGHVFDDGPSPGGRRYCINSVALCLAPAKSEK